MYKGFCLLTPMIPVYACQSVGGTKHCFSILRPTSVVVVDVPDRQDNVATIMTPKEKPLSLQTPELSALHFRQESLFLFLRRAPHHIDQIASLLELVLV